VFDVGNQTFFDVFVAGLAVSHDGTAVATMLQACVQALIDMDVSQQEIGEIVAPESLPEIFHLTHR
jgi:uncharacterized membrane protein